MTAVHTAPMASPIVELVPVILPALFSMEFNHQRVSVSVVVLSKVQLVTNVNLYTGTYPRILLMDAPNVNVTLLGLLVVLLNVTRKVVSATVNPTPAVGPAQPAKMASTTFKKATTLAVKAVSVISEAQRVSPVERGMGSVAADLMWKEPNVTYLVLIITSPTSIT